MLVAIGKGIELDVDVTRFNSEVHDHIVRTGLRNLLMDAHASATAKADPEGYVTKVPRVGRKETGLVVCGDHRGAISRTGPESASLPSNSMLALAPSTAWPR